MHDDITPAIARGQSLSLAPAIYIYMFHMNARILFATDHIMG